MSSAGGASDAAALGAAALGAAAVASAAGAAGDAAEPAASLEPLLQAVINTIVLVIKPATRVDLINPLFLLSDTFAPFELWVVIVQLVIPKLIIGYHTN
ncbi:unannotated protein [freshwater metagenome]|uniref:Unannotated protein n=1 Tax=freshwater metagenome TaxID=449393 RepID=A0A6J7Q506_9ZZZZ